MLLNYVLEPDPSGLGSNSIAMLSLDRSFEEECRSLAFDHQVESALPLGQFSALHPSELWLSAEESMVGEQLKCSCLHIMPLWWVFAQ